MKALPRGIFDRIVQSHLADKHSKGFGCRDQLLAMVEVFGQSACAIFGLESAGFCAK